MKLYHGSDVLIDVIILDKSKPFKDFGKGFYLSDDYNQAFDMAKQRRNRNLPYPWHNYDIVYGPIADDGVTMQLRRFEAGYLTIEQLVEELKYDEGITFQYYFANEKAISKLKKP